MTVAEDRNLEDRLVDLLYPEGQSPAELDALRREISARPDLSARLRDYEAIRRVVAEMPAPEPERAVHYEILRQARAAAATEGATQSKGSLFAFLGRLMTGPALAGAFGLMVAIGGAVLVTQERAEAPAPTAARANFDQQAAAKAEATPAVAVAGSPASAAASAADTRFARLDTAAASAAPPAAAPVTISGIVAWDPKAQAEAGEGAAVGSVNGVEKSDAPALGKALARTEALPDTSNNVKGPRGGSASGPGYGGGGMAKGSGQAFPGASAGDDLAFGDATTRTKNKFAPPPEAPAEADAPAPRKAPAAKPQQAALDDAY